MGDRPFLLRDDSNLVLRVLEAPGLFGSRANGPTLPAGLGASFFASGLGSRPGKVTDNNSMRQGVALLATVYEPTMPKLTEDFNCEYKVKFLQ